MNMKITLLATALLASGVFPATTLAATNPATATFQVTLTINKACTVTTSGPLNLGSVDANTAAGASNGASVVSVTCSKGTAYNVGLAPSAANGGTANGTGNMISSTAPATNTDKVPYTLYQDAAFGTVWGNTVGTNTKAGTGTGTATALTVYGKAPNVNFTPDSYADTVTVNVTY